MKLWPGRRGDTAASVDRRPTVRQRLVVTLALAVVPAGILAIADSVRAYHTAREAAERSYMSDVLLAAQAERDAFVGIRRALEALAVTPAVRGLEGRGCNDALGAWVRANPTFALSVTLDTEGRVRCASNTEALGAEFRDDARFKAFLADPRFTVDAVPYGPFTGERVVVAYSPVWRGELLAGAITVSVRTGALEGVGAVGRARVQPHRMALVDAYGAVIIEGGDRETPRAEAWLPSRFHLRPRLGWEPAIFPSEGRDGNAYVLAAAPLVSQRIWLVAAAPAESVYAGVLASAAAPIAAPLLMWLLAIGVAYVAIDRLVVQHVIYLAKLTRAYGRGRLDLRPEANAEAPREIAMLGQDLARMAGQLETREGALREAAEAKRVLLAEVYHRVKNNLQMIVSLLSLQRRRAASEAERAAISRIEGRVHSLALVHQKLYASGDLTRVALDDLCRDVVATLAGLRQGVDVTTAFDPVEETPERATPLALLLNEALTNALKYAGTAQGRPKIAVGLHRLPAGGYRLEVSNDTDRAGETRPDSIGARLMAGFARQIRGRLEAGPRDGRFLVRLDVPPAGAESGDAPEALAAE